MAETKVTKNEIETQEAWNTPSLTSSWVSYGGGFQTPGYYKDSLGIVHVQGLVKSGSLSNPIFTLPAGYRPNATIGFPANTDSGIGNLQVLAGGAVQLVSGGTSFCYLDSIQFRAAQ